MSVAIQKIVREKNIINCKAFEESHDREVVMQACRQTKYTVAILGYGHQSNIQYLFSAAAVKAI